MTQQEFFKRYTFDTQKDHLGEGGFGEVFKAYDTHLDRWVAIKQSKVKKGQEHFTLKKEVDLATKLPSHPNIANYEACFRFDIPMMGIFDFGILQYYEEGNLEALLKAGKISNDNIDKILIGILNGLSHLHKHNIIHRDIKPANILIVKRGEEYIPKITDFGISKQGIEGVSSVSNSIVGGTFNYAAPEQLKGDDKIHNNADLWSFGVIVYQLLTKKLPFQPTTKDISSEAARSQVTSQILSGNLPNDIDNIQAPYNKIIKQCLVVDTRIRVKTTQGLIVILNEKPIQKLKQVFVEEEQTQIQSNKPNGLVSLEVKAPISDKSLLANHKVKTSQEIRDEMVEIPPKKQNIEKAKFLSIVAVMFFVLILLWNPWKEYRVAESYPVIDTIDSIIEQYVEEEIEVDIGFESFIDTIESVNGIYDSVVSYPNQDPDDQSANNGSGTSLERPSDDPRLTNHGWGDGTSGGNNNNGTGRGNFGGVGNGSGGGSGSALVVGMGGRTISKLITPKPDCKQAGIVAIDIEVNKQGKIVRATTNYNRCTTTSECLIEKAKEAALSSSFVSSSEIDQFGTIIYTFQVN